MQICKKIDLNIKTIIYFIFMGFSVILFSSNLVYGLSNQHEEMFLTGNSTELFFILISVIFWYVITTLGSKKKNALLHQLADYEGILFEKSKALENQNNLLKEYAFLTSHNLRKPLANILGLVQLCDLEKIDDQDSKLAVKSISEMAKEIDELIKESTCLLEIAREKNNGT